MVNFLDFCIINLFFRGFLLSSLFTGDLGRGYFSFDLNDFDFFFDFLLLFIKYNKYNIIKLFIRVQGANFKILFWISSHEISNLFCLVLDSPGVLIFGLEVYFKLFGGCFLFSLFGWLFSLFSFFFFWNFFFLFLLF